MWSGEYAKMNTKCFGNFDNSTGKFSNQNGDHKSMENT